MWLHQSVNRPTFRQNTTVADDDSVILNAYLYRGAKHIAIVSDGIIYSLANGISRKGIGLNTSVVFVSNFCLKILKINQIYHLIGNINQGIFQGVLIQQIHISTESSNLNETAVLDSAWISVKQQNRRPLQFAVRHQVQFVQ